MKDYFSLFVRLSLQQCKKDDYQSKQRVKEHNIASKKLKHLYSEMGELSSDESNVIMHRLLVYNDERVKLNAAVLCLQMKVLISEAEETLKNIIENTDDVTLSFSAKMILQNTCDS